MNNHFIIRHWGLTLLLAPLTSAAIHFFWGKDQDQVISLVTVYPITLLFSIIFSIPTLLVYLACFYLLTKQSIHFAISKAILIAVSIAGIYITQTAIAGTISYDIILAYGITSVIIGLLLKIKKPDENKQEMLHES